MKFAELAGKRLTIQITQEDIDKKWVGGPAGAAAARALQQANMMPEDFGTDTAFFGNGTDTECKGVIVDSPRPYATIVWYFAHSVDVTRSCSVEMIF